MVIYQCISRTTLEFEKQSTELLTIEERIDQLEEDKVFLKEELEVAISELPDNYITAKRKLREDYNPQILQINNELLDYKKTRADLEIQLVSTGVDVGPAIYLARTFGTDIDTVVKFFIFILIFVFDPLAVMLVIAYNQALIDRNKQVRDVARALPTEHCHLKRIMNEWILLVRTEMTDYIMT